MKYIYQLKIRKFQRKNKDDNIQKRENKKIDGLASTNKDKHHDNMIFNILRKL